MYFKTENFSIGYRPELQNLLDYARDGDTIVVHDFSRLARSTKDLLNIVENLEKKSVKLISAKEQIDSNTPNGKLMLTMIGAINEFERANLLERQREGIALAKIKGVYKGRKQVSLPQNWLEIVSDWCLRKISVEDAIKKVI